METVIDWVLVSAFIVVFVIALYQVVMRYVFSNPPIWSEELIRLMFVWICYLGWTVATRNKTHIQITALVTFLPPTAQKVLKAFNCLLVIGFSVFMVWFGIKMVEVGSRGMAVTLPINFGLVYLSVPIANAIIVFYQILDLVDVFRKPEEVRS
jgi:TRAP-type C4-dicarboxylate transport system permease small subunit